MKNATDKVSIHWKELDILRGLAAVLMIANHVGYKTINLGQVDGIISGNLLFISSFAPVLFFFITGVGYGLQSSQRQKASRWFVTFNKVVILVLADLIMHWSGGRWLGLDFLGFIGFSSLVLELVRNSKSPLAYCIAGFASVSLMRYLLGPIIHSLGYDQQMWGVFGFIFGTSNIPGISYPLSPWLAYPFAGYVVGVVAMHYRNFIEKQRSQVVSGLLKLACFPGFIGLIMSQRGFSFFRWGTVALGFYVVSFAVLLVSLAWSLAICGKLRLAAYQNALSLSGIASLAVVPLHYFLIDLATTLGVKGLNLLSYCILATAILAASFSLARLVERLSQVIRKTQKQNIVWFSLVAMFLLASSFTLTFSQESTFLAMFTKTFGQIVLCLLFVVRPPSLRQRFKTGTTST